MYSRLGNCFQKDRTQGHLLAISCFGSRDYLISPSKIGLSARLDSLSLLISYPAIQSQNLTGKCRILIIHLWVLQLNWLMITIGAYIHLSVPRNNRHVGRTWNSVMLRIPPCTLTEPGCGKLCDSNLIDITRGTSSASSVSFDFVVHT